MGLIFNNKEIWDSGEVPDNKSLYNFNGKRVGLTGNYNLASGSSPNYEVSAIHGNSINLTDSIKDCNHGILITFEQNSAEYDAETLSNNSYSSFSFSNNPIKISKDILTGIIKLHNNSGAGDYTLTVNVSDKNVKFSTSTNDGTLLDFYSEYQGGKMITIKSIVSY